MSFDISALSSRFTVRQLTESDVSAMLPLAEANPVYYRYHFPAPSSEDMLEGLTALPPGKTMADKYYVGFFDGKTLTAVLDLVLDYPETGTAFIGLFMLDTAYQGKGVGSSLFSGIAGALASSGYRKLRLAIDKGNPQSEAFWTKNGFTKTGEEYPNDFSAYLPMERLLKKGEKNMPVTFRKATAADIDAVTAIYDAILAEEEAGRATTGWKRGIYPVRATAEAALARDDLFVAELDGKVAAAAVLNHIQVDVYAGAPWEFDAPDEEIFVMHTLVVDPAAGRRGLGRAFEAFYEQEAARRGCRYLRIDTNVRNTRALALYHSLGYKEISVAPCTFNGLRDIDLVLLEKAL